MFTYNFSTKTEIELKKKKKKSAIFVTKYYTVYLLNITKKLF